MIFNISGALFHPHGSKYIDLEEYEIFEKNGAAIRGWRCPKCTQSFSKEEIEAHSQSPKLKGKILPPFNPENG